MARSGRKIRACLWAIMLAAALVACSPAANGPQASSPGASAVPSPSASGQVLGPPLPSGNAFPSGSATPAALPASPTPAPPTGAVVRLSNLTGVDYLVRVYTLDASGHAAEQFGIPLTADAVGSQDGIVPGVYRFTFVKGETATVKGAPVGSCDFALGVHDIYDFVVLDDAVALASRADQPGTTADLLIGTSPLCQAKATATPKATASP